MRLAREGNVIANPKDIVKQPTVLEFLGLEEKAEYSDSDLETALCPKMRIFMFLNINFIYLVKSYYRISSDNGLRRKNHEHNSYHRKTV